MDAFAAPDSPRPRKRRQVAARERQRAVRACAECRRLKEKCEGGTPCKRCSHLRRSCEYSAAPTSYRRASSLVDPLKESADRIVYMERLLKHHAPDLDLSLEGVRLACDALCMPSPSIGVDETCILPATSDVDNDSSSGSPGIENVDCTIDNVDGTIAHYSGEFSHWNFSMHVKRNIDDLMAKVDGPGYETSRPVPDFIRVGAAHPDATAISEIVALLPPRPVSEFLKNVFFKHATSVYYYIGRLWVDCTLEMLYTDTASLGGKSITAACAVMMVLAVGTQYAHLESPKRQRASSAEYLGGPENESSWELDIGSAFYRQVAKLLSEVIHAGSLLSVQVCLLLGLYSLPVDASGLGYIYLNLALKLAVQNGLHRKSSPQSFDPSTAEVRRRVWWTAYCMERKIGIYHGRPAAILQFDVDAEMPRSTFDEGGSQDHTEAQMLLETIDLISQAESFLREISQLRKCQPSEARHILRRMKQARLERRPGSASALNAGLTNPVSSRPQIHLSLDHYLLDMFVGRPFILAHGQSQSGHQASNESFQRNISTDMRDEPTRATFEWDFLIEDCISAAEKTVEILATMQHGQGLARSSYIEYSSCRASLLVLIAYSIRYRTNTFAATLEKGLDAIREMAAAGESARSEVMLIESLEGALRRLKVFDQPSGVTTKTAESVVEESYEGFATWYRSKGHPVGVNSDLRFDPNYHNRAATGGLPDSADETFAGSSAAEHDSLLGNLFYHGQSGLNGEQLDGGTFADLDFGCQDTIDQRLLDNLMWIPD